jgi:HxlR-like helix-turn-helix
VYCIDATPIRDDFWTAVGRLHKVSHEEGCTLHFGPDQRARKTLDLIADKWTILVLFALRSGKRRFAELRREIRGVTEKMLIQTLRNLERDGIVGRNLSHGSTKGGIQHLRAGLEPGSYPRRHHRLVIWESGEGLCGPRGVRKEESPRENSFGKRVRGMMFRWNWPANRRRLGLPTSRTRQF